MELNFIKNEQISKLAWCSIVKRNSNVIDVYHGLNIEKSDHFFVEGAWNGEYQLGNFKDATFFMGSGAIINSSQESITFSTPSHTLERLYTIKKEDKVFVSNSLPFILYMSDSNLKMDYYQYEKDLNSILNGYNDYKKFIPLENNQLQLHYYCNFTIDINLNIVEYEKTKSTSPIGFEEYYLMLKKDLKVFVNNANSQERNINYELVTTISKGYDAPASAAIAADLGCNVALTFDAPQKYAEDSGGKIAKELGYKNVIKKNAHQYLNNTSFIEAEFVSSGELGTGIVFSAFEKELENKIAFFGERGDRIWNKNSKDVNSYFRFKDEVYSGTSIIEHRLRVGYIYLPVPIYNAENWEAIHKISNSKSLNKYSVGGEYDRPIPRKIVEDKGIKRTSFGREKMGAGFNYRFDNLSRLKYRMSDKSYYSFYEFYKKNRHISFNWIKDYSLYLWSTRHVYLSYLFRKMGLKYKGQKLTAEASSNPGAPSYLFHWGNKIMIDKYSKSKIIKQRGKIIK